MILKIVCQQYGIYNFVSSFFHLIRNENKTALCKNIPPCSSERLTSSAFTNNLNMGSSTAVRTWFLSYYKEEEKKRKKMRDGNGTMIRGRRAKKADACVIATQKFEPSAISGLSQDYREITSWGRLLEFLPLQLTDREDG
jgi:hypothetical protein